MNLNYEQLFSNKYNKTKQEQDQKRTPPLLGTEVNLSQNLKKHMLHLTRE